MDFNFLFTYYIRFDKVEDFIRYKHVDNNTFLVIEVPYNNIEQAEAILYNILSEKELPAFNILITSATNTSVNKKWLSIVVALISHIGYKKCLENKQLWFAEDQAPEAINELANKMKGLGFNNISTVSLGETVVPLTKQYSFFYLRSLSDDTLLHNAVTANFFSLTAPFQIVLHHSVINSIAAVKQKLADYIQQQYTLADLQLLQKVFALNENISTLQTKLQNQENLLNTRQAYLDFLLNQYTMDGDNGPRLNEELKIRKFYYYEYEILPLWYKQLGHIVKVLIGKRSFKSLFNDKIKKYKD